MTTFRITDIEVQKKNPGRRSIYLDGAFAFGLDEEVVLKHHLHEGDELEDTVIQHILIEEETARAKKKALALLSYRSRSVFEIRDRLGKDGYDGSVIDRVADDFMRVGLLDDTAFASAYVQTRLIQKPMGKRLLLQELRQRGIDESLAGRAVEQGYGGRSEYDMAREIIEPRLRRYRKDTPVRMKKKVSDFLSRRGFEWDVIGEVLTWAVGECGEGE
ncbi:RecX family transcriptional regulator [bacterium]|nr:RecX family transcriptional regulator [bacterium]